MAINPMPDIRHCAPGISIVFARDENLLRTADPASIVSRRRRLSDLCLLTALSLRTGGKPDNWRLHKSPAGRPVAIDDSGADAGATLSLSHSASIIVAAAGSSGALGIDLETRRKREFGKIAEYLDWPVPGNDRQAIGPAQFFKLWTLWEACIKTASDNPDIEFGDLFNQLAVPRHESGPWRSLYFSCADEYDLTIVTNQSDVSDLDLYCLTSERRPLDRLRRLDIDTLALNELPNIDAIRIS